MVRQERSRTLSCHIIGSKHKILWRHIGATEEEFNTVVHKGGISPPNVWCLKYADYFEPYYTQAEKSIQRMARGLDPN
jgi:hypothetical protein